MQYLEGLPSQGQLAVGILLMALGVSFVLKSYLALVKGRMAYWEGFLPLTLVSPFLLHLPPRKRSLVKETEGLWVHALVGPVFMITALLTFCAGADLAGLKGTPTLNTVLNGGKTGADLITFDTHNGYRFPIMNRVRSVSASMFGKEAKLNTKDQIVPTSNGSLQDSLHP